MGSDRIDLNRILSDVKVLYRAPRTPTFVLHFDGVTSGGNPGAAGIGYVLSDPDGNIVKQIGARFAYKATENVANYKALLAGLQYAVDLPGVNNIRIIGNSELVCRQVHEHDKPDSARMQRYCTTVKSLLANFTQWRIVYIAPSANVLANGLATFASKGTICPTVHLDKRKILKECNNGVGAKQYVMNKRHEGTDALAFILKVIYDGNSFYFEKIEDMCRYQILPERRMANYLRPLQQSCEGQCRYSNVEGLCNDFICMACSISFY